jgi:hypothetical protein
MISRINPVSKLNAIELSARRLAVENAIGSLRIENMEVDRIVQQIIERYACGDLKLDEMNHCISQYTDTIR